MSQRNLDEIEELFLAVLATPEDQREAYVDQHCWGNEELKVAVWRLLDKRDEAKSFLEHGALAVDGTDLEKALAESVGDQVGPYKLLRVVGEGGMGVVYLAEQQAPVRRQVALKVIKPGMDTKQVIARFEAERQALAMMDHPFIARVFDAATTDACRPYFVMEFVGGLPITEYCDNHRLNVRQRLELFAKVCRAIQHAHQKGIIHRDIKPSNVLVTEHDGEAAPKVIDFGVAKALDRSLAEQTLHTTVGQTIGTPQYMSPEQAWTGRKDVDTRSDIYSLGVLLFELLVGSPPLDSDTVRAKSGVEICHLINSDSPQPPSSKLRSHAANRASEVAENRSTVVSVLAREIKGDLDRVVSKAIEKDRELRYESAQELCRDVQRYLANEPVEARAPTLRYQLEKLYQRNRAAVTAVIMTISAVLVAFVLVTLAWSEEAKQRQQALRQTEAAQRETSKAHAALSTLQHLLADAAPSREDGVDIKLVDYLKNFSDEFDESSFADKQVEMEVRLALAKALANFSLDDEAQVHALKAEKLALAHLKGSDIALAEFLVRLSDLGYERRRMLKHALRLIDTAGGDRILLVNTLTKLGEPFSEFPDESDAFLRRAVRVCNELSEEERQHVGGRPHHTLARALCWKDEYDEAIRYSDEAVRLASASTPNEHVGALLRMSEIQSVCLKYGKAELYAQRAMEVAVQAERLDLQFAVWRKRLLIESQRRDFDEQRRWGVVTPSEAFIVANWSELHSLGPAEAIGHLHGALLTLCAEAEAEELRGLAESLSPASQDQFNSITGDWLRNYGDVARALEYYSKVKSPTSWTYSTSALAHGMLHDFDSALRCLNNAEQTLEHSDLEFDIQWIALSKATVLRRLGRVSESREVFVEFLRHFPNHSPFVWGDSTSSMFLWAIEECRSVHPSVHDAYPEQISLARARLYPLRTTWATGRVYTNVVLGMTAEREGRQEAAFRHFIDATRERYIADGHMYEDWVVDHMVGLLVKADRGAEAEAILRAEIDKRDKALAPIHPIRAFERLRLVEFLVDQKCPASDTMNLVDEAENVLEHHRGLLPQKEWARLHQLRERIRKFEETEAKSIPE
ncbi:MAG: serine/threonine-protein kinase [Pirellulaceae bacterium]